MRPFSGTTRVGLRQIHPRSASPVRRWPAKGVPGAGRINRKVWYVVFVLVAVTAVIVAARRLLARASAAAKAPAHG